jgi:hypothetical protein
MHCGRYDTECMHCGRSRYVKVVNEDGAFVTTKVAVKQLRYMPIASEETMKHMRWHKEGKHDSEDTNIMYNLANTEAREALDFFDPKYAREPRSVLLALSIDGFQPHSDANSLYSSWPVFVMPYSLLPNKCLKQGSVFLALVILCPKEPRKQVNIFLCPLIEEMKELWQGVDSTYVLSIYGQSVIIWHMGNLPIGVSTID